MASRGSLGPVAVDVDVDANVFRWAWLRTQEHMHHVVVSGLLVGLVAAIIGAVAPPHEHASAAERAVQAGGWFLVAFGAVALVAGLYALFRAPYEQRNALRARVLDEAGAGPHLDVEPAVGQGTLYVSVTNRGPTDHFQIFLGDMKREGYPLWWGSERLSNGRSHLITEKMLVRGAHAVAQCGWPDGGEAMFTFLSRDHPPMVLRYSIRQTALGVREIKPMDDEWPERGPEWVPSATAFLADLTALRDELVALPHEDIEGARRIDRAVHAACSTSPVAEAPFMWRFPASVQPSATPDPDARAAYLGCLDGAINAVRESVDRGTDVA